MTANHRHNFIIFYPIVKFKSKKYKLKLTQRVKMLKYFNKVKL